MPPRSYKYTAQIIKDKEKNDEYASTDRDNENKLRDNYDKIMGIFEAGPPAQLP